MPSEKEYNGNLFDQLTLLERIERQIKTGNMQAVQDEVNFLKNEVNRKLYQKPPLTEN